ncbi:uncharacterized protein J7T54_003325 [Emericellopsis cladophorae]|uniref:Zn(2)-C6 fungal-type domain-containing protein n=1 Tax=Emericellopsis cladophorae TaxID=2686198 RepID=A0A9P9XWE3_9HYPO|nr:uncharacterized protein J7T54_003325 [Emericellopsis cladophorae]KAI6778574.1 hypothetical protein J7T54_003325 [Emericellopsis cladophorae]
MGLLPPERHVKCDEKRPVCSSCERKALECSRPSKKTVFRHDTTANFSKDQQWVNSAPRQFQLERQSLDPDGEDGGEDTTSLSCHSETPNEKKRRLTEINLPPLSSPESVHVHGVSDPANLQNLVLPPICEGNVPPPWDWTGPNARSAPSPPVHHEDSALRHFPLQDVQEACLMRYYIDEIGHWLDLCDEERHFQLVVPVRARRHPYLLNAVFAVAARHLARMPQYQTKQGIVYQGQHLPDLDRHTAVEYMLQCIPALRRFHDTEDDEYRDSIIATAVILRQLEEIDDEDDGDDHVSHLHFLESAPTKPQINFLPIIDAVLRSPPSQSLFGRRGLIRAAYWMALRQEIYHSFTRRQAPQMILAADYWPSASSANKAVMHTVQVVKWRWGNGSEQEWSTFGETAYLTPADEADRLMRQQEHLDQDVLMDIQPIYYKEADRTLGEIFPTVWYSTVLETTTIQQALMAKSVLYAENPALKSNAATRNIWRKVESDVRGIMIQLCGIALCHPGSPPAILNAAFVLEMFGDFFTDHYEREAIKKVVERYRAQHAWPARKLVDMFG